VSSHDPAAAERLARRYRSGPKRGVRILLVGILIVLAVLVAWFGWALWVNLHPKVTSGMETWQATSQNRVRVTAVVRVHGDDITPTCTVEASDEDGSVLGRLVFHAKDGRQTISFKTERKAARVTWDGCTAPGQKDAR